jgi:hypothetical protein
MNIVSDPLAPILRGLQPQEDFTTDVIQTPLAIGGSATTTTVKDITWNAQINAGSDNNFKVATQDAIVTSETPGICTVSGKDVSRVANGVCNIIIRVKDLGARRYSQDMARTGSTTVLTDVQSVQAGSLLKYLLDQRTALLSAVTPTAANQRSYVNGDGSGGINTGNMLLRADISGFTPLNISPMVFNAYRWITPRHRIFSYHTNPYWGDGSSIVQSGTAYGKNIGADTGIVYHSVGTPIASADQCKVLPSNWRNYLPSYLNAYTFDIPLWYRRYWVGAQDSGEHYWMQAARLVDNIWAYAPLDSQAATFAHPSNGSMGIGNDSGSPVFMGINSEAVLTGHIQGQGGRLGVNYGDFISQINAALVATATAGGDANPSQYAVQTADLSGFNFYA